jgi:sn-glycerol 3-phosphate transport system permease protein
MVERTPIFDIITQVILAVSLVLALAPFVIVGIAATHTLHDVNQLPMPIVPGNQFLANLSEAWHRADLGPKLFNSFMFALGVGIGKVAIASISAFSIVFFTYRGRKVFFWLVFMTLMLPLEVRIVPTYAVAANVLHPYQVLLDGLGISWLIERLFGVTPELQFGLLNTYPGLVLPLIATATGTFLYRQFFLTLPEELVEAAKMDGAGPLRFFWQILLPLSRGNMAALFTIMFVWGWNEYLWPLLVTTEKAHRTAIIGLRELVPGTNGIPEWNIAMAGTLIVMLPPLIVVIVMQRWFVRGLVATEK